MTSELKSAVAGFLEHRRALGRKYLSEEAELRLLLRFAEQRGVGRLDQLTIDLLDDFLVPDLGRGHAASTTSSASSRDCSTGP